MGKDTVSRRRDNQGRGRYPTAKWFWVGAAIYLIVAIPTLAFVPGMLLENWMPGAPIDERNKALGTAGQLVLIALGGVIAVVGVALSLSRHGEELKAATTADERELRARFIAAVDLVGDAKSATRRSAGMYALAALADDWCRFGRRDEMQVCIDVLCGYLRAPRRGQATRTPPEEVAVRAGGFAIIADHLRRRDAASWSSCLFNLDGVVIDYQVRIEWATLDQGGEVRLEGATINEGGSVSLNHVRMEGGSVSLNGATINEGGSVSLKHARINGNSWGNSWVSLGATINEGGSVSLNHAKINDGGRVFLYGATINEGGSLQLLLTEINDGGYVHLDGTTINKGGEVRLDGATINKGGEVHVHGRMSNDGGSVHLDGATIRDGGWVHLDGASIRDGGSVHLEGGRVHPDDAEIFTAGRVALNPATIRDGGPIKLPDGRALVPTPRGPG